MFYIDHLSKQENCVRCNSTVNILVATLVLYGDELIVWYYIIYAYQHRTILVD